MREKKESLSLTRYTIEDTLGTGGMGTVYLAHHEILDRPVALKVPRPELARNDVFVQRFLREARALGTLNHPNIVAVYDAGIEDETPYIAMEYVAGETLKERIYRDGRVDVDLVVRWGIQMARALAYLHDQDILHRDLKSANVIINEQCDAVVADFGIVQIDADSDLTQGMIGTPTYMSPEQAMGLSLDARSDLYSFGIILYECITGDVPFRDDNSYALLQKVIHQSPEPVIVRRPDTPQWLVALITRCLSKSPDDRYVDGHELLTAFGPGMDLAPVQHMLPATRNMTRPPRDPSAAEHLSLAFATLARSFSLPRWQTLQLRPDPTVTFYEPGPQQPASAPPSDLVKRSIKPLSFVLVATILLAIMISPYAELSPTTASNNTPPEPVEDLYLPMGPADDPQGSDSQIQQEEKVSPSPVGSLSEPQESDSTELFAAADQAPPEDSSGLSSHEIELLPVPPAEPEIRETQPLEKANEPPASSGDNGRSSRPNEALRLPPLVGELSAKANSDALLRALEAHRKGERLNYGDRRDVTEPDLAYIFLTNAEDRTIRALLVPTLEGWLDYYRGNIITEEGGRFYQHSKDSDASLKSWLGNVEPIWVELREPGLSHKKPRRLGW